MAGKWVESKVKRYKKVRNFEFTFKRFSFTTELLEFCSRAPIWIRYDAISIDEYITLVNVDSALTHLTDLFLPIAFRAIDLPMLHVLVCIGVRKNVRPNDIDEKALAIHWQNPALESILHDARRDSSCRENYWFSFYRFSSIAKRHNVGDSSRFTGSVSTKHAILFVYSCVEKSKRINVTLPINLFITAT